MELEVLNPRGLPQKSVVSISIGGTRRQIPLSGLDRPLRFPGKVEDVSQIKVDVLNVMGSCRLPYDSSVDKYTVPLDNVSTDPWKLESPVPNTMELDLIVRSCDPASVTSPSKEETEAHRKKKESASSDYLEEHGLVSFMQFLLTTLMQDKPTDPYHFLHKQIARQIAAKAANDQFDKTQFGTSGEADVYSMLDRLSPMSAGKCPAEDLERLEREAVQAAQKLRSDNADLRETALQLKDQYELLMKESIGLKGKLDAQRAVNKVSTNPTLLPHFDRYYNRFVGRQCGRDYWNSVHQRFPSYRPAAPGAESPLAAAMEINGLQDEVASLANENAKLVADLARGREMLETVRKEILGIRGSLQE
jgi:hypothetical protein